MALAAYRHVLRSTRIAFQNDPRILSSARAQARSKFNANRHLGQSDIALEIKIAEAEEVARMLRENVVQGEQISENEQEQRYRLNIHPETERGDNESIKLGTRMASAAGGCCGGGT